MGLAPTPYEQGFSYGKSLRDSGVIWDEKALFKSCMEQPGFPTHSGRGAMEYLAGASEGYYGPPLPMTPTPTHPDPTTVMPK
jgi:hypothetical protein